MKPLPENIKIVKIGQMNRKKAINFLHENKKEFEHSQARDKDLWKLEFLISSGFVRGFIAVDKKTKQIVGHITYAYHEIEGALVLPERTKHKEITGSLSWLVVSEEYRKQNIGFNLRLAAVQELKNKGVRKIVTASRKNNEWKRKLDRYMGFKVTADTWCDRPNHLTVEKNFNPKRDRKAQGKRKARERHPK